MTDDERALVSRAQAGDADAFARLVEHARTSIYRLAYDLTGNREDAEDLSQDVFIKAYRSLKRFRADAKWTTWLYRITINTHLDHVRPKAGRAMEYTDELEYDAGAGAAGGLLRASDAPGPDRSTEAHLLRDRINRALAKLTERERSVFVLRHYHDLPLRQIAGTLGLAEGSVKAYLFRGLQRLKKELACYRSDLGVKKEGS